MSYHLSKKWNFARTRNGLDYMFTFDSKLNLKPLFLKKEYIEKIKDIRDINDVNLINNLLLLGLIESDQKSEHKVLNAKIPNHIDFLYSQAFYSRTPIECKVELTYSCNLGCRFCLQKGLTTSSIMSLNEIEDVFCQLRELGVVKLFLTGGEIFVLPEILKIVELACQLGFLVTLQTNATLLSEKIIEALSVYNNLRFNVSFHGADAEIFNNFVQSKVYEKVISNLKMLKSYRIKTRLIYNVTSYNRHIYNETIQWFKAQNFDYHINYEIYPNLMTGESNSEFVTTDIDFSNYICEKYGEDKKHSFENAVCDAAIMKMRISPEGDVFPCGLIRRSLGNIRRTRLISIWESEVAKEIITTHIQRTRPGCENCKYTKYCSKCNAMIINGNWKDFKPLYCYKAKEIYKINEVNRDEDFAY